MSQLTFLRVRFTVRAHAPLRLGAYAGPALRGAFGHALLRHYCIFDFSACRSDCPISDRCGYRSLFESPISPQAAFGAMRKPPRPYVITPTDNRAEIKPGGTFQFTLTLFGSAAAELPRIVRAIEDALPQGLGPDRVPCELVGIDLLDVMGNPSPLDGISAVPPVSTLPLEDGRPVDRLTLVLDTPLRLKNRGVLATTLVFSTFWRALTRRLLLLGVHHCGMRSPDFAFPPARKEIRVVESRLRWTRLEHYSSRQRQRNALGGLVGAITFAGELGPYLPYLRLGEITHVGSGCVYGLGRYRVKIEDMGKRGLRMEDRRLKIGNQ